MTSINRQPPSLPELWARTSGSNTERAKQLFKLFDDAGIPPDHAGALHIATLVSAGQLEKVAALLSAPAASSTRAHDVGLQGMRGGGFVSRPRLANDAPSGTSREKPVALSKHYMFSASGFMSEAQRDWAVAALRGVPSTPAPGCALEDINAVNRLWIELPSLVARAAEARRYGPVEEDLAAGALLRCAVATLAHSKTDAIFKDVARSGSTYTVLMARRIAEQFTMLKLGHQSELPELKGFYPVDWCRDTASADISAGLYAMERAAAVKGEYAIAAAVARVRHSDGTPLGSERGAFQLNEQLGRNAAEAGIAATGLVSRAGAARMLEPSPVDTDALIARGRAFIAEHLEAASDDRGMMRAMLGLRRAVDRTSGLPPDLSEALAASVPISFILRRRFPDIQYGLSQVLALTGGRGIGKLNVVSFGDTNKFNDGTGDITLDENAPYSEARRLLFHEVGHAAENEDRALHLGLKAWLERRAGGRPDINLRDAGYNIDAPAKNGSFVEPYVGRVYDRATEVLSMGLEHLTWPDTMAKLYAADEEHFALTLGWLISR